MHTTTTDMSQNAFVAACRHGHWLMAKTELKKPDTHVDRESEWGCTGLHSACVGGHLPVIRWLIEDAHADISVTDLFGGTPFWLACSNNRLAAAKLLAAHGANPYAPNNHGQTPFWTACCNGHLEVVRWLAMTAGVGGDVMRPPVYDIDNAPLAIAKMYGRNAIVSWLTPFLLRRVLIAYWGAGRTRQRAGLPDLGNTAEAAVWHRLPRQAMANVLLLLLASL